MSGIIGSKLNIRGSGRIAKLGTDGQVLTSSGAGVGAAFEDAAGGLDWQSVTTGSTLTAVAGNGYPIDTTSNICTITLPASASVGDEIIFTDYAGTWGTYAIFFDPNGLNYQSRDDTFTIEYGTDGMTLSVVYMDATQGWVPTSDEAVADVPVTGNSEGIFGYGSTGSLVSMTNLVSDAGVVSTDVTGVGTARTNTSACEYGDDKGIFGFGQEAGGFHSPTGVTNLVSNAGVVATDVSAVGTARQATAACNYGGDKGIFGFGYVSGVQSMTNLVSNVGVVATDTTGVGMARFTLAACEYGEDTAIFGFGEGATQTNVTNLVSNVGVVATDTTGVGSVRYNIAACSYGGDKGIFGYGYANNPVFDVSMTNLVSNVGVVATDTTGVGTARRALGACEFGNDKGIFGYGTDGTNTAATNLVSNVGVVSTDVTGVGTARNGGAGCSFN